MPLPDDLEVFIKHLVEFISKSATYIVDLKNHILSLCETSNCEVFDNIYEHIYIIVRNNVYKPKIPVVEITLNDYRVLVDSKNIRLDVFSPVAVQSLISDRKLYSILLKTLKQDEALKALRIIHENNMFKYIPEVYRELNKYAEPVYRNIVVLDLYAKYDFYSDIELYLPERVLASAYSPRITYVKIDCRNKQFTFEHYRCQEFYIELNGRVSLNYHCRFTDSFIKSIVSLLSIIASAILAGIKTIEKLSKVTT